MGGDFENVGCCEMSPSKRSIRFLYRNPDNVFDSYFYISLKDLEDVIRGHRKTATLWRPKE